MEYQVKNIFIEKNVFSITQSLSVDKIIKNKIGLELVTSHYSGYKTSSKKFLY